MAFLTCFQKERVWTHSGDGPDAFEQNGKSNCVARIGMLHDSQQDVAHIVSGRLVTSSQQSKNPQKTNLYQISDNRDSTVRLTWIKGAGQ